MAMAAPSALITTPPRKSTRGIGGESRRAVNPGEDPPGIREASFGKLYLAYLRDPDGNKLCGLHRPEQ